MENQLWTYLVAITLLTMTPGVDTLLVIRNTTRGGFRDGAVSSFGICSGLFVHATVSAVGISLILLQSAIAFSLLKFAGAGYLIWLGGVSLRKVFSRENELPDSSVPKGLGFRPQRSFVEGFLSNVLNPKTIIFYMAFLPQFIDPSRSALQQSLLLAGIHFLIAMVWQSALALLVKYARSWLTQGKTGKFLEGLSGSILMLLGLKLALDR
jgi:threonine/homoserine/homoserine lactone efflux protein